MRMTAMPQRIALSQAFGALAATLVGIGEYITGLPRARLTTVVALAFEVFFGGVTVTGSLMAFDHCRCGHAVRAFPAQCVCWTHGGRDRLCQTTWSIPQLGRIRGPRSLGCAGQRGLACLVGLSA
jgi:hypothetical protein